MTEALADQKAHSRRGVDLLVEMLARDGTLPAARLGQPHISITSGEDRGEGFYPKARVLARDLKHMSSIVIARTLKREWGCKDWHSGNVAGILFPPLKEMRETFDKKHGTQDWPDKEEWE